MKAGSPAVALGFKAGLFNIGVEGQFTIGAICAAWAGQAVYGLPAIVHLPLTLLAGAVGQVDVLNTFCHAHTPVLLSLLRMANGLCLGMNQSANGQFFRGDLCEILIYARALSASENHAVHRFLRKKWGIGAAWEGKPEGEPIPIAADVAGRR